jgi:hypothetical protein
MITNFKQTFKNSAFEKWLCEIDGNSVSATELFNGVFSFQCWIKGRNFYIEVIPLDQKMNMLHVWENRKKRENQFRQKYPDFFSQIMEMRKRIKKLGSFE